MIASLHPKISSMVSGSSLTPHQRQALETRSHVWVRASAGSGKTKILTDRLLKLMLNEANPHAFLCLTFTKAAAAEMYNRLQERLSLWSRAQNDQLIQELTDLLGQAPQDRHIQRARELLNIFLDAPGGVRIQTLHGFCMGLLQRFPMEAGIAPHFRVLEEVEAQKFLFRAQETVLSRVARTQDGPLAQAYQTVTTFFSEQRFFDVLWGLMSQRERLTRLLCGGDHEDFAHHLACFLEHDPRVTLEDLWKDFLKGAVTWDSNFLRALQEHDSSKYFELQAWHDSPSLIAYEGYKRFFLTASGKARVRLLNVALKKDFPHLEETLRHEQERILAYETKRRHALFFSCSQALFELVLAVQKEYAYLKVQRAFLDYHDLIETTNRLLDHDRNAWVLYKLDHGLNHILVDEAQDTSREQWQIIQKLSEEFFKSDDRGKSLFVVGDPKQSIYSFQGADPALFDRMRLFFKGQIEKGTQWKEVPLDVSFRSAPVILNVLDAVFSNPRVREGVSSSPLKHDPCEAKAEMPGCVELWPLVRGGEAHPHEPWEVPQTRRIIQDPPFLLARQIARRIRRWLDEGEVLSSTERPIAPQDILILLRRRGRLMELLVRALKKEGVPVAGMDRMRFDEQLVVQDLLAFGEFCLTPFDDLVFASVLKGPLVGMDEEALFELAYDRGQNALWSRFQERFKHDACRREAVALFDHFIKEAPRVGPSTFYLSLLNCFGGERKLLSTLGTDAQDALEEFVNLAQSYERQHVLSLQHFLGWFRQGGIEIKRDLEQKDRREVRIMTVHGSKGLQAPIVILPDTTYPPRQAPFILWNLEGEYPCCIARPASEALPQPVEGLVSAYAQEQREEYQRLLYVAMTRTQERLYIGGWGGKTAPSQDSWYRQIEACLKGLDGVETFEVDGEAGYHLSTYSERARRIFERASPVHEVSPVPDWFMVAPPLEKRVTVHHPSTFMEEKDRENTLSRQDALIWGTALHEVLEVLPALNSKVRRGIGRSILEKHGVLNPRGEATLDQIEALFTRPDLAFLWQTKALVEVPVYGYAGDVLVSGRIDRLCVGDHTLSIVDFKTGMPDERAREKAWQQLNLYAQLLDPLYPDHKVSSFILWIPEGTLEEQPDFRK